MSDDGTPHTISPESPFAFDRDEALALLDRAREEILAGQVGFLAVLRVPPTDRLMHHRNNVCWHSWTSHASCASVSILGAMQNLSLDYYDKHIRSHSHDE